MRAIVRDAIISTTFAAVVAGASWWIQFHAGGNSTKQVDYIVIVLLGLVGYIPPILISLVAHVAKLRRSVDLNTQEITTNTAGLLAHSERIETINICNTERDHFLQHALEIFGLPPDPVNDATREAIRGVMQSVNVEQKKITFSGNYLYSEATTRFWNILSTLQLRLGADNPIVVRATHLANAEVWSEALLSPMWEAQAEFRTRGGIIYRIFLHGRGSGEKPDKFVDVISKMHELNIAAYYLDLRSVHKYNPGCDYLIVKIGDSYYSSVWTSDYTWTNGEVRSGSLAVGREHFMVHWNDWKHTVGRLAAKKVPADAKEEDILAAKPPKDMIKSMLMLS